MQINLDISKPETVEFVKSLFDEYITGDDPVFVSRKVHIGTDEYPVEYSEIMRAYINELIEFVNSRGYTPRFWGSCSATTGSTEQRRSHRRRKQISGRYRFRITKHFSTWAMT